MKYDPDVTKVLNSYLRKSIDRLMLKIMNLNQEDFNNNFVNA